MTSILFLKGWGLQEPAIARFKTCDRNEGRAPGDCDRLCAIAIPLPPWTWRHSIKHLESDAFDTHTISGHHGKDGFGGSLTGGSFEVQKIKKCFTDHWTLSRNLKHRDRISMFACLSVNSSAMMLYRIWFSPRGEGSFFLGNPQWRLRFHSGWFWKCSADFASCSANVPGGQDHSSQSVPRVPENSPYLPRHLQLHDPSGLLMALSVDQGGE